MFYLISSEEHYISYAKLHDAILDSLLLRYPDADEMQNEFLHKKSIEICEEVIKTVLRVFIEKNSNYPDSSKEKLFECIDRVFEGTKLNEFLHAYLFKNVKDPNREGLLFKINQYPNGVLTPSLGKYQLDKMDRPCLLFYYFNGFVKQSVYSPLLSLSYVNVGFEVISSLSKESEEKS